MGTKRKLPLRPILADIKAGISNRELEIKYSISSEILAKVFRKLVEAELLTPSELPVASRRALSLDSARQPEASPMYRPIEPRTAITLEKAVPRSFFGRKSKPSEPEDEAKPPNRSLLYRKAKEPLPGQVQERLVSEIPTDYQAPSSSKLRA